MPRKKSHKVSKEDQVQEPYKTRESELVALWLSVPLLLHGMDKKGLRGLGYDIDDNGGFAKIVSCKTRRELASALGINRQQITRWEETDWMKKKVEELNKQSNVLRFKKDIDYNFTQRTLLSGSGSDIKVWYELFCGYKSTDPSQTNADAMLKMAETIKALADKK